MIDNIMELFLKEAILYSYVLNKLVETKKIHEKLSQIFLLHGKEKKLFSLLDSEAVKEIDSETYFKLHLRAKQYFSIVGGDYQSSEDEEETVLIKGRVIHEANEIGLLPNQMSNGELRSKLKSLAEKGNIKAMRILAFLIREESPKESVLFEKTLNKLVEWNSVEGLLMALFYNEDGREENLNRLFTIVRHSDLSDIIALAQDIYGKTELKIHSEVQSLERAFSSGRANREIYTQQEIVNTLGFGFGGNNNENDDND